MTVLHPYSTKPETFSRQAETWAALSRIRKHWQVVDRPCTRETDYENALRELWGRDDILIIEHDVVPTTEAVSGLEECRQPLCAQAYRLGTCNMANEMFRQVLPELRSLIDSGVKLPAPWDKIIRLQAHLADTGAETAIAHRKEVGDIWEWVKEGDEWADFAGFGMTKISLEFQKEHPPGWRPGTWQDLDSRFSNWVKELGYRWHIHWPEVKHNHL